MKYRNNNKRSFYINSKVIPKLSLSKHGFFGVTVLYNCFFSDRCLYIFDKYPPETDLGPSSGIHSSSVNECKFLCK